MKIVEVEVCRLESPPPGEKGTPPRREPWTRTLPGTPMPVDGRLGLPPGPGFGLQAPEAWLKPF